MQDHDHRALVVGASGATGRLLAKQLLDRGYCVRVILRNGAYLPEKSLEHERLSVIRANLLELSDAELAEAAAGCQAVASCLGHNMSWKGIFGPPYRLVTDTVRRLCTAVKANRPEHPVRFVLMNTAGNSNRGIHEPISTGQGLAVGLLRLLVPPHADNEQAADYLRTEIGHSDGVIEWVVVRPDTLVHEESVSEYALHPSPIRSAIFDAGSTSRVNVAHFMADLISEDQIWARWKGQMPVMYNASQTRSRSAAAHTP